MKKYIFFQFLIGCFLNLNAQNNTYTVSSVKGVVTDSSGKKIAVGAKLKLSDKLVFGSKTSVVTLAHPDFGRVVITPGSGKVATVKNNLFTILLKDILPEQMPVVAAWATPPQPAKDTIPKPKYTGSPMLRRGEALHINEALVSMNHEYELVLKDDGNLCLYKHDTVIVWSTQTNNNKAKKLILQPDGNLGLYDDTNKVVWETNTKGGLKRAGDLLILKNEGELILYNVNEKPVWKNTVGKL